MGFPLTGEISVTMYKKWFRKMDAEIMEGQTTCGFKGLCAETQKKRKRSLSSSMHALTSKELHEAEEQESLLK